MIPIPDPIAQKESYIRWMAENVPFYDPEDPEYREHECLTQDSIPKNVLWPMDIWSSLEKEKTLLPQLIGVHPDLDTLIEKALTE